jgi:hypothetical protein
MQFISLFPFILQHMHKDFFPSIGDRQLIIFSKKPDFPELSGEFRF